jgi:UDP-glucuronate 4-epimerase
MKILVTGAAGFIGYHLVKALVNSNNDIVGIDNINDYYDINLKYGRLTDSGIQRTAITPLAAVKSNKYINYRFIQMDLTDRESLNKLFDDEHFTYVCNLAAQAGVRYSIINPYSYIESNIVGYLNLLEACRHHHIQHFIYASSSSIYGMNQKVPFSEDDQTDSPVSLYAATKKSDELMAYAYSKLYNLQTTGVRFFTVYGPWGRPDMAPFIFMKSIIEDKTIKVFNNGHMLRDFTYIDDIITGLTKIIFSNCNEDIPYRLYNIGNSSPVKLMNFIESIEHCTQKKAKKEYLGMQPGDVVCTYADTKRLEHDFGYKPNIGIDEGISKFYDWFVDFYGIK